MPYLSRYANIIPTLIQPANAGIGCRHSPYFYGADALAFTLQPRRNPSILARAYAHTLNLELSTSQAAERGHGDLLLPSVFVTAVAALLAVVDPIYYTFQPRLVESLALTLVGAGVTAWGVFRARRRLVFAGTAFLFALILLEVGTQPFQLGVSALSVWPLRVGLALLVLGGWLVLLAPVSWVRRGLIAGALPTLAAFALVAGPSLSQQFFAGTVTAANNFSPYWLAVDSKGTLYATNLRGNTIWVFDAAGNPQGTIRPGLAPASGATPGPGIVPIGYEPLPNNPVGGVLGRATPTPTPVPQHFGFCGTAVDPSDNLYVADPINYQMLRFDRNGDLRNRWPLPRDRGYQGTRGCLAADGQYVYFASRFGAIYFFSHEGKTVRRIDLPYQPFGIALDGYGNLLSMDAARLDVIEITTGKVTSLPLPPPPGQPQIPYQSFISTGMHEITAADFGGGQLVRIELPGGRITGTVGGPGRFPGQFQSLGGLAKDAQGRIYAADWGLAVIQRFTPAGGLNAVWWAPGERTFETEPGEGR